MIRLRLRFTREHPYMFVGEGKSRFIALFDALKKTKIFKLKIWHFRSIEMRPSVETK